VKKVLKSLTIYRSYRKINIGRFLNHPVEILVSACEHLSSEIAVQAR